MQVKPKKHVITLEMTSFARSETVQQIPLVNNSDRDWVVKITLVQDSNQFSVNKDLTVKRGSTNECILTFSPDWVCEVSGRLVLEIPATK